MKKIIILLILFVIIVILFCKLYNRKSNNNMFYKYETLAFDSVCDTLFFSGRIWGISGNHEEIILSSTIIDKESWNYNKDINYVFYTSEIYYKVINPNKLIIYAPSSTIGKKPYIFMENKLQIEVNELRTYKEVLDYSKNYQKYGLKRMGF